MSRRGDVPATEAVGRRALIGLVALAPLLLAGTRSRTQAAPCVNLDTLPAGQKGMRRSLGFKLQSPDPGKRCCTCSFFTPAADGCGKCALFSGGAVAAASLCDSWAAKR